MDISPRGLEFIKKKEGYFDKAYLCPAGVWTIGYGSIRWKPTIPVKKGDVCTADQAEKLLLDEVRRVEDDIDRHVKVPLSQGQFDCLVSFFYNLGTGWLTGAGGHQKATFVKYLNRGEFDKIPSELLKFKRAGKKVVNGLAIRRQEEIQKLWFGQYNTGDEKASQSPTVVETVPAVEPMPQKVEPEIKPTTTIVKESPTAQVSIFATLLAAIGKGLEWSFGVAKDASVEAVSNQQSVSGLKALFDFAGVNATSVALLICVGALLMVLQRRLAEGKR